MLAEGEAELTAAAVAEINQLGDAGSSDLNILDRDVDAAITELEKGAAWEEDVEEVEFDLEPNLTMSDDELAQLASDIPAIDTGGSSELSSDDANE